MGKWLAKLKKDEIWQMHKEICEVPLRKRFVVEDRKSGVFTFWEGGWDDGDGKTSYLSTTYCYHDYAPPVCVDASDIPGGGKRFFCFMVRRFGKEYLADFLAQKTGVDSKFFLDYLK